MVVVEGGSPGSIPPGVHCVNASGRKQAPPQQFPNNQFDNYPSSLAFFLLLFEI